MNPRREWFLPKGAGFEGTHPMTGEHYELRAEDDAGPAAVWVNGRHVRQFASRAAAWDFVADLVRSEADREAYDEELKTPAERAAELADAIDTLSRYRKTRPTTDTTATLVRRMADYFEGSPGGLACVRMALPLVKDALGARLLAEWLAEREASA